jgi:hypothetical protein
MARQTPEGRVKDAVKKLLKAHDVWYYMPVQNGMGVVGIPDLICCIDGKFLAIETKAPGKLSTLTANQKRRIEEIRTAGGEAMVVDNPQQVEDWLNAYTKEKSESKTEV